MSEYKNEEYFPIYVRCLRANQQLSFDCYILLRQSNRIILWVRRNEPLTQSRYEKLQGHSFDKVYIRIEDKPTYFEYLDGFLNSTDGASCLKEIQENNGAIKIEGLPDEKEYKLKALSKPENFGKTAVEDKIEGPLGDVIQAIKSEVSEFEKTAVRGLVKELTDRKVIEDCTLRINEELIRVEDRLKRDRTVDQKTIDGIKNHFTEQITLIKGTLDQPENAVLKQLTSTITDKIEDLHLQAQNKKANPRTLGKKLRDLRAQIDSLTRIVKEDPHAVVSHTISRMIGRVEKQMGQRICLDPNVATYEEIPEHLSQRLNLDDVMTAKSEDIKTFQHQIIKQQLLIQELNKRYETNCKELKSLRDKWYLFQVQAKKNLSGGDILIAKEIDKEFQKFETEFGDIHNESDALINVSNQLTDDMGGQHIEVDPQLLAAIGVLSEDEQRDVCDVPRESAGVSGPTENNEDAEDSGEFAQFRSENEVLKAQFENAQKLLEASNLKIEELTELNEKNNELNARLDEQNEQYRKVNASLEEKVERFQTAEDTFNDTLDSVSTELKMSQNQVATQEETMAQLREQIDLYSKELCALKENANLDESIKSKDELIEKLKSSMAYKQEELKNANANVLNLNAKLNETQQKYKHLSHKTDRMAGEIESLKKSNRSAQAKAEISANTLNQMRKTVSKLTEVSDQLRKDRQTYILKTNEAMLKYEAMMNEASTLNRQVAADSRLRSEIESKLDKSKNTEKKLRAEVRKLKNDLKMLQDQLSEQKKAG